MGEGALMRLVESFRSGRNRRRAGMLVAALCGAVGLAACGTSDSATIGDDVEEICAADPFGCVVYDIGAPIELGALLWLSQETPGTGVNSRLGVELAIDYLDGVFDSVPGDLLGHRVELLSDDDGCSAAQGVVAAERLRVEPGLLAVVGTSCSSASLDAAARVLSADGIVLVSPSATAPALTRPDTRERFFFRTAPNDLIQGAVVADFVGREGLGDRAASVDDGGAYSSQLAQVFGRRVDFTGGELVAKLTLDGPEGPVDTAVAELVAAAPSVVFLPLYDPSCSNMAAAIRAEPALDGVTIIVGEACLSDELLNRLGPAADGILASGPDFSDTVADAFYVDEFLPAFERRFGSGPPGVFHTHSFDAANLIFDATRRVALPLPGGAFAVPRSALRAAMLDLVNYRGLSGRITCRPSGDCAQSARVALYEAPLWPVGAAAADVTPIFSQEKTLAEVESFG